MIAIEARTIARLTGLLLHNWGICLNRIRIPGSNKTWLYTAIIGITTTVAVSTSAVVQANSG
jgi:hypothetical protein